MRLMDAKGLIGPYGRHMPRFVAIPLPCWLWLV
jgi:hypothetical protein